MNTELSCHIRWRWFLAGLAASASSLLLIYGIHSWQMPRIANRVLTQARELRAAGDLDGARRSYGDFLQFGQYNVPAMEEYAQLMLQSSDALGTLRSDSTALQLLDIAIQSGSATEQSKRLFVQTALRQYRYSEAHQILRTMDLEKLRDAELWTALGRCELHLQHDKLAEAAFRNAIDADASAAEAWTGLLEVAMDVRKDAPQAWKIADEMLRQLPVEGQSARAFLHLRLDQLKEAGQAFLAAATAQPKAKEHVLNLGQFIMRTNMDASGTNQKIVQFAYDHIARLQHASQDFQIQFLLADLMHRSSQHELALKHYQRCIELHPGEPAVAGRMAEVLSATGQFTEAEAILTSLPETGPQKLLRSTLRAQILMDQSEWQLATEELQSNLHMDGDKAVQHKARLLLLHCLQQQKNYAAASKMAKDLALQSNDSGHAIQLLAETLITSGEYEEAIRQIQMLPSADLQFSLLNSIMTAAKADNRLQQLQAASTSVAKINEAAVIPTLLNARLLFESGSPRQAVSLLLQRAVEDPSETAYWDNYQWLKTQPWPTANDALPLAMTADPNTHKPTEESHHSKALQLTWICRDLCRKGNIAEAAAVLKQTLQPAITAEDSQTVSISARVTHAEVVATVIETIALEDLSVAGQLLTALQDTITWHINETSGSSMEPMARILLACHRSQDMFKLTPQLYVTRDSLHTVRVLRNLVASGMLDPNSMQQHNTRETAKRYPEFLIDVLLAEASAQSGEPADGGRYLDSLTDENRSVPAVAATLLQFAGYDQNQYKHLPETGFALIRQLPDNAEALFALSCGLSNSGRMAESVKYARQAFLLRQHPVYLLHAAGTLSRMDQQQLAHSTLQLALDAGLANCQLTTHDQHLLRSLQSPGKGPAELTAAQ